MSNTTNHPTGWNDERVETLKALHADGLSASLIARQLGGGLSRNAVIGKIHRLGIQRTGGPSKPTTFAPYPERKAESQRRKRQPVDGFTYGVAQRPKQQYQERPQPAVGPISSPNAKVWTERAFGECAYPISGEGADTWSCCSRADGSGYCPDHDALMHVAGSKSDRESYKPKSSAFERTFGDTSVRAGSSPVEKLRAVDLELDPPKPKPKREPRTFEEWAAA